MAFWRDPKSYYTRLPFKLPATAYRASFDTLGGFVRPGAVVLNTYPSPEFGPLAQKQRHDPPLWALRLGYAGLAPFVIGALLVWLVDTALTPFVMLGLAAYAAVIASFLGGIYWGLAMRSDAATQRFAFGWGVVPSLVSAVAVIMPPWAGLVVLGALLIACYWVDRKHYGHYGLRPWLTLRFRLTVVASLCCFLGASGV